MLIVINLVAVLIVAALIFFKWDTQRLLKKRKIEVQAKARVLKYKAERRVEEFATKQGVNLPEIVTSFRNSLHAMDIPKLDVEGDHTYKEYLFIAECYEKIIEKVEAYLGIHHVYVA